MDSIQRCLRAMFVALCTMGAVAVGGTALADPPTRVGRLAYVEGPVSFAPAGGGEWVTAPPNRPLVTGDRIWADAGARTELEIGSAAIRIGAQTSAAILNLDDRIAQFEVTEGTVSLTVRRIAPDEAIEIDTPNLALSIRRPGEYRVDVDANVDSTAVAVRRGEAEAYGEGAAYTIPSGRWYRFYATGLALREYATLPPPDALDRWAAERDRRFVRAAAARYVSPETIGYEDLDHYGTWSTVQGYGPVWTPSRVPADWAPYREGHWAWIDPWGWTWVDDAPWGFAPFHYGRWAFVRERWCWVPGPRSARPVYAPALVAFVGDANFQLSIATGPVPGIAWFPLGPGEVYRPPYHASYAYFDSINVSNTHVSSTVVNNVYRNNVTHLAYHNRNAPHAITAVPSTVFERSVKVAAASVRVSADDISKAPITAVAPVAPSRASVLGAGQPARVRPPEKALDRQVVAKATPPAPAVRFEAKQEALARHPGRPLDATTGLAATDNEAGASAEAPRVKVVKAHRPESVPKGMDRPMSLGQARQARPSADERRAAEMPGTPEQGRRVEAAKPDNPAPKPPVARSTEQRAAHQAASGPKDTRQAEQRAAHQAASAPKDARRAEQRAAQQAASGPKDTRQAEQRAANRPKKLPPAEAKSVPERVAVDGRPDTKKGKNREEND